MEYFKNLAYEATNNYFNAITKTGYLSPGKTNQVLLLDFLVEFLEEYNGFITEKDYNIIDNIVTCLQGTSCLVPYEKYKFLSEPVRGYIYNIPVRITEQGNIRNTEEMSLRLRD